MKDGNYNRIKINFIYELTKIESNISLPCDCKVIIK